LGSTGILKEARWRVSEKDRLDGSPAVQDRPAAVPYSATGHPSVEQLIAEQGTGPITDVAVLHGSFWPEEESVEEFVATIREWRGHQRTEPPA
jgi:hypothetical protein